MVEINQEEAKALMGLFGHALKGAPNPVPLAKTVAYFEDKFIKGFAPKDEPEGESEG